MFKIEFIPTLYGKQSEILFKHREDIRELNYHHFCQVVSYKIFDSQLIFYLEMQNPGLSKYISGREKKGNSSYKERRVEAQSITKIFDTPH